MTANADETYWRQDGINHYVWYGGNDDLAFFHIDRHRSSDVVMPQMSGKTLQKID
jgi:hypothetical protein